MYEKHFECMYTGSMYGAGANVFAVWGYIIAHTNKSYVELNPKMMAATLGMKVEDVEEAIKYLASPDRESRSPDYDGKRIIQEGSFNYFVVNHEKYSKVRNEEERREQNRLAKRRERERKKNNNLDVCQEIASSSVSNVSHSQPMSAHKDKDKDKDKDILTSTKVDQTAQDINEIFNYYLKTLNKKSTYQLTQKRKSMIKQSLEAFGKQSCLNAIECFANDDWPERKNYTDVDHIFKASARYRWCVEAQEKSQNLKMTDDDWFVDENGNTQVKPESLGKYNAIKNQRS